MNLTPQELHYFKRELISQELSREIKEVQQSGRVASLIEEENDDDYPFLRYLVKNFVLEFPLLKNSSNNKDFWNKLQTFLDEYNKLKLDNYAPKNTADSQRRILMYKMEKMLIVALGTSIKTVQGKEEAIKLSPGDAQHDDEELATNLSMTKLESEEGYLEWIGTNGLEINVCTVRDVKEVRTIREHVHGEFIINTGDVFVARRHGHFRTLRDDLKASFPTLEIPSVPSKASDSSYSGHVAYLHREKDRVSLRAFLRRLAAETEIATSPIFKDFLTKDPIQLTEAEKQDAEQRRVMDQRRIDEEKRFRAEVDKKMSELDGLLGMLKEKVMRPNGLIEIFEIIKTTSTVDQLPSELKQAFEWGRINFAFVLHTQFVTSDKSVENIANLKRTHTLMPYRAIAQILKLSNPFAMVKGVLDLFLAQPFGGRSLFQRILLTNMNEESKEMQKDIEELQLKINDPLLCKKVENAVKSDRPAGLVFSGSSINDTLEMLKNPAIEPVLSPQQILKVAFANQKDEARLLVEQLYQLWVLYSRKQEREVLMALVFQGVTGEIIKDLFAIFYEPLAQVYKAANIGDTIGHVSGFIDDLIKTVDSLNIEDVSQSAQPFINLVQRHEQEFYQFVHNVHAQDQSHLFDDLLGYVNNLFSFVATGIPTRIDLDLITQEAGVTDTAALKREIDAVCEYHRARKERHLQRRRAKLMATSGGSEVEEEALAFLPNANEVVSALDDFAEITNDSDDEDEQLSHELTIKPPTLEYIPKIGPTFVKHVQLVMKQ
ncbi:hypothetical protein K501DRAFT_231687 [Backusella circina FSU 941]|nr:hypothetical protein K501DRAFT_231687 [Backusella circina FSU 941]